MFSYAKDRGLACGPLTVKQAGANRMHIALWRQLLYLAELGTSQWTTVDLIAWQWFLGFCIFSLFMSSLHGASL